MSGEPGQLDVDPTLVIHRHAERQRELAAAAALVGPVWTTDIVGARLEEAFRTLMRPPEQHRPRGYSSSMPKPIVEMADMVARAENGSLSRLRSQALRRYGSARQELERMDEALCWPAMFLNGCGDVEIPLLVNLAAMAKAMRAKINATCREIGVHPTVFYRKRREGLQLIVAGLARSGKAPL
jgi:hypothetical protein